MNFLLEILNNVSHFDIIFYNIMYENKMMSIRHLHFISFFREFNLYFLIKVQKYLIKYDIFIIIHQNGCVVFDTKCVIGGIGVT